MAQQNFAGPITRQMSVASKKTNKTRNWRDGSVNSLDSQHPHDGSQQPVIQPKKPDTLSGFCSSYMVQIIKQNTHILKDLKKILKTKLKIPS